MKTSLKIKITKERAAKELSRTGMVLLGAATGLALSKTARWLSESHPTINTIASYAMPPLLAGGGFLISAATEENSKLRYFGYGLTTAGVIDGIRITPFGKDFLSGVLGSAEIGADQEFLTESEERRKLMGSFGQSALPVGRASMQPAEIYKTELPELPASSTSMLGEDEERSDLGYNSSFTDDADSFNGVI